MISLGYKRSFFSNCIFVTLFLRFNFEGLELYEFISTVNFRFKSDMVDWISTKVQCIRGIYRTDFSCRFLRKPSSDFGIIHINFMLLYTRRGVIFINEKFHILEIFIRKWRPKLDSKDFFDVHYC